MINRIEIIARDLADRSTDRYARRQGRRILEILKGWDDMFSDELKAIYDYFRLVKPEESPRQTGAAHAAYRLGREKPLQASPYPLNTVAHAAWCAGVDDAKERI